MKRAALGILFALGACGDDGNHTIDAGGGHPDARTIDGAPEAPDAPPPLVDIELQYYSRTGLLLAYRDGTGPWQPLTIAGNFGQTTIHTTGRFEVAYACGTATQHYTAVLRNTLDDGGSPFIICYINGAGGGGGGGVHITGTMVQPGTVQMASSATSDTGPWTYDLETANGTDDLFAYDDARIVLRRGIDTSLPVTLDPVDLATEGTAFTSLPWTLSNVAADESLSAYSSYLADIDGATLSYVTDTLTVNLMPDALMEAQDFQYVDGFADSADTTRSVDFEPGPTVPSELTLLPRLSGIVGTASGATWTTLPPGDVSYRVSSDTQELAVDASPSWLGPAAVSLSVDLSTLPGFDAAWLPSGADLSSYFSVNSTDANGVYYGTTKYGVSAFAALLHRAPPMRHLASPRAVKRQAIVASRKILP